MIYVIEKKHRLKSMKSSNARRIAGMSQCVGYGVIRKVSSIATLFGIIPSVSAVLGCVQYICTFLYHVYNSVLVRRIFNGSLGGLR